MKRIVVYYFRKGSNRYLARKIAEHLSCDIAELKPRLNVFPLFLLNIHMGNRALSVDLSEYDQVILCGPIWIGRLIPPLRSFLTSHKDRIKKLIFVTCCGSTDAGQNDKFGYATVFGKVRNLMADKCQYCRAFPIGMVLPEERREDPEAFMNTHLNDQNFQGIIRERFDQFILEISQGDSSPSPGKSAV